MRNELITNVDSFLVPAANLIAKEIVKEINITVTTDSWDMPVISETYYSNIPEDECIVELKSSVGGAKDPIIIQFRMNQSSGQIWCDIWYDAFSGEIIASFSGEINRDNQGEWGDVYGLMECFWDSMKDSNWD